VVCKIHNIKAVRDKIVWEKILSKLNPDPAATLHLGVKQRMRDKIVLCLS